jgi:hypothetical protein
MIRSRSTRSTVTTTLDGTKTTEPSKASKLNATGAPKEADVVRFIQINSAALCAVLHEYARFEEESWKTDAPSPPLIMLAPFQPICLNIEKLKEHARLLKAKCGQWEAQSLTDVPRDDDGQRNIGDEGDSSPPRPLQRRPTSETVKSVEQYLALADELAGKISVHFVSVRKYMTWSKVHAADIPPLA